MGKKLPTTLAAVVRRVTHILQKPGQSVIVEIR